MAHLHFDFKPRRMQAHAGGAKLAVQYLTRSGPYEPTQQRDVAYLTRQDAATRQRGDLIMEETRNLPGWAYNDATLFFQSAEAYERKNGQYAVAIQASLPRELPREQQLELMHDFLESQLKGKPLLVVVHEPIGKDGQPQPHFHVLASARTNDGAERTASGYFRRSDANEPGAAKDRFFVHKQAPARLRQAYSDLTNAALERAGSPERVDPRSLWTRGVEREAAPKATRAEVDATRAHEQRIAEEHWQARKITLGLRPGDIKDRATVREHTYAWSRDMRNLVDRSPGRAQELRQAWTRNAKQAWEQHDQARQVPRSRERMPSPTIPVPDRTYPKGHFEVDLDREALSR